MVSARRPRPKQAWLYHLAHCAHARHHCPIVDTRRGVVRARNVPGDKAKHIARTHDTIVQSWIRGEVEIIHRPEWNHWEGLRPYSMGAGITNGSTLGDG